MFSKYTLQQQQLRAAEAERLAKRRGDHMTPARKERRIMRIYGKTRCDCCSCRGRGIARRCPRWAAYHAGRRGRVCAACWGPCG